MKNSKKFALIGEKLSHSFSKEIHNMLGDYQYELVEIEKGKLGEFFEHTDLDGFNVTIPYKNEAMEYCKSLSDRAKKIGCVNTVVRLDDGNFYGDNTDYFGFQKLLGDTAFSGKALVLGSGGASKTVKTVLEEKGFSPVVVISRSGEDNYENLHKHFDAKLIVNATPVGMYPHNGKSPLSLKGFKDLKLVLDLIYNPARPALLLESERLGIENRNGLYMLVAQAKLASEQFLKKEIDDGEIEKICRILAGKTQNIVLIGMPGSGKSTIGRALAEYLGRSFADTDALFEEKLGITPENMIISEGELAFREKESEILSEVCKKSGLVVSTGGGIVTLDKNYDIMHQNGIIVYIDRNLNELVCDNRPLSIKNGVEKLYEMRAPKYNNWCDFSVKVKGIDETAKEIIKILKR